MRLSLEHVVNEMEYDGQPGYGGPHDDNGGIRRFVLELRSVLGGPHATAEERIRQAKAIISAIPGFFYTGSRPCPPAGGVGIKQGGLAPWQVRSLEEFIEQRLALRLTGAELARRVGLSEHHFCRAFRVSLGQTPHAYVIRRRLERACDIMLSSPLNIGQIASECGFADQAHLNRCFRKVMGTSPGVWRRAHRGGEAGNRGQPV